MSNNQQSYSSQNMMSEALRLEYLSEMQISSWVLREPFQSSELFAEVDDISTTKVNTCTEFNKLDTRAKITCGEMPDIRLEAGAKLENKKQISEKEVVEEIDKLVVETGTLNPKAPTLDVVKNTSNQFLNLVSWNCVAYTERAIAQNGMNNSGDIIDKDILIVCRHKINQPANSFANKRGPSHFMQDYLKILVEFGLQNKLRLNIQLAHLAEAGLGESSIKIESFIKENQPDLTYVLGDETVKNLINKSSDVKDVRCRLNKFLLNANAIVSYHPFDLISNPRLKSLAYEDIQFVINNLLQISE